MVDVLSVLSPWSWFPNEIPLCKPLFLSWHALPFNFSMVGFLFHLTIVPPFHAHPPVSPHYMWGPWGSGTSLLWLTCYGLSLSRQPHADKGVTSPNLYVLWQFHLLKTSWIHCPNPPPNFYSTLLTVPPTTQLSLSDFSPNWTQNVL